MKDIYIDFLDLPNAIASNKALLAEIENLKLADKAVIEAENFDKFTAEDYAARVAAALLARWRAVGAYAAAMSEMWSERLDRARGEAIQSHQ